MHLVYIVNNDPRHLLSSGFFFFGGGGGYLGSDCNDPASMKSTMIIEWGCICCTQTGHIPLSAASRRRGGVQSKWVLEVLVYRTPADHRSCQQCQSA